MELRKSNTSLKNEDLTNFEKDLNVKLPDSFKKFYLSFNGGIPSHRYFKGNRIASFCPIKYGGENQIENVITSLGEVNRLPQGFIPFAFDSGGWYFCVNLGMSNNGLIYMLPNGLEVQSPIFVAQLLRTVEGL